MNGQRGIQMVIDDRREERQNDVKQRGKYS